MTVGPAVPARLLLLGGFELELDGVPATVAGPARQLLAHLAVRHRRRPASRAALAERLWPGAPPGRAGSNLRSVLWRLPRPRGRQLVVSDATAVRLAALEVDLYEAEQLAAGLSGPEPPDAELLADLSALGEDLLPDWTDEWLTVERESHRQRRLHALERCSTYLREVGRYGDALAAGLTAVHSEPLRESAHRRVIEAHLAEGNDAEALRQFDGYRRLMADELGLPPSPVIRRMVSHLTGRPVDLPGR